MAAMLICTLRGRGQYAGDILLVCNELDSIVRSVASLATIQVADLKCHIRDDRMHAMRLIDASKYDQILNLDADILCLNPIDPLFQAVDELRYYDEWWGFLRERQQMYTYYMDELEVRRYAWCHTINVGHWCVSGNQFTALYDAWKRTLRSKPYDVDGADQAAFNTVVRRGFIPAKPFDSGLICTALAVPEPEWKRSVIIHFAGWLDHRLEKMQDLMTTL
jgi:hypothetical protein